MPEQRYRIKRATMGETTVEVRYDDVLGICRLILNPGFDQQVIEMPKARLANLEFLMGAPSLWTWTTE